MVEEENNNNITPDENNTSAEVPMFNEFGQLGWYSPDQVQAGLNYGYSVATPEEVEKYRADKLFRQENSGILGDIKTFGQSALNEGLLGLPEHFSPEFKDNLEKLKQLNPIAGGLGSAAGFVAPLALTGGLSGVGQAAGRGVATLGGKYVAKNILGKAAQSGIKWGVEGAVSNIPFAVTDAIKDPENAAEAFLSSTVFAGGLGALLGSGGRIIGEGVGKAGSSINKLWTGAKTEEEAFRNSLYKSMQATSDNAFSKKWMKLVEQGKKPEELLKELNLIRKPGETFNDYLIRVKEATAGAGNDIQNVINKLVQSEKTGLDILMDFTSKRGVKLNAAEQSFKNTNDKKFIVDEIKSYINSNKKGVSLNDIDNLFDEKIANLRKTGAGQDKANFINNYKKDFRAAALENNYEKYKDIFNKYGFSKEEAFDLLNKSNLEINFSNLNDEVRALQNKIYEGRRTLSPNLEELEDVLNGLKETRFNYVDKLAKEKGLGEISSEQLKELNRRYHILSTIEDGVETAAIRMNKNNPEGLIGAIKNSIGDSAGAALGIGGILGDTVSGGLGWAAIAKTIGYLGKQFNKYTKDNAGTFIANFGTDPRNIIIGLTKQYTDGLLKTIPGKFLLATSKGIKPAATDTFYNFLHNNNIPVEKGENKEISALNSLRNRLNYSLTDPNSPTKNISSQYGYIPEFQSALDGAADRINRYLLDSLPKDKNAANPFGKQYVPTKFDFQKFKDRYDVATNPYSVIDKIEDGTITKQNVEALKALYPNIYKNVKQQIINAGFENPNHNWNNTQKGISNLFVPDTTNPAYVKNYQASYSPKQIEKATKKLNVKNLPGSEKSSLQRISM